MFVEAVRIKADADVVVSDRPLAELLGKHSGDASVVFLGFQAPEHDKVGGFHARHTQLFKGLPTTLLICSTGDADLLA